MPAKLFRPHQHVSNSISFIISILLLSLFIPRHNAKIDTKMYEACNEMITDACNYLQYYSDCSNTSTIRCGNTTFKNPEYPFWGDTIRSKHCGLEGFELRCEDNDLVIDIGSDIMYRVLETKPSRSLLTLNYYDDPLGNICASREVSSTVLNESLYVYGENTEDLNLFYNCDDEIISPWIDYKFTCGNDNKTLVYFFLSNKFDLVQDKTDSCTRTTLQVDKTVFEELKNNSIQLDELFKKSFEVHYNQMNGKACTDCSRTGGWCWRGTYITNNTCIYSNGTVLPPYPQPGNKRSLGLIIGIGTMPFLWHFHHLI